MINDAGKYGVKGEDEVSRSRAFKLRRLAAVALGRRAKAARGLIAEI
jgi:hypothetical protein